MEHTDSLVNMHELVTRMVMMKEGGGEGDRFETVMLIVKLIAAGGGAGEDIGAHVHDDDGEAHVTTTQDELNMVGCRDGCQGGVNDMRNSEMGVMVRD